MHEATLEQEKKESKPSLSARSAQVGVVAHDNEGVICVSDFIQPILTDDHIEDFLAEFENIASFKAWPRSH